MEFCKAYNSAAGSPAGPVTPLVSTAHCDVPGYPSCYSLGYADGKAHPGTNCPSGHSASYCDGYRAGAGSLGSKLATNVSASDVAHCDQSGYPSCYSVGYQDGKAHPGTPCPSGHSANFCSGWNAGAGNSAHCDSPGWPSCYSIGYADGQTHPGTTCPSGHTQNYCAGWNAGAGNTAHCDQKGWPSCYDMGYLAGKAHPGTSCPPSHSKAYCNGYATGAGNIAMIDTHCDTPNFPSCYSLGYQDGKNASPGTPCPSGHSLNYCTGWQAGNPLPGSPTTKCTIAAGDASYPTAQDTSVEVTLAAQDNGKCVKPITMSIVSEPKDGGLKLTGTNKGTYTPNAGFIGTDSFQYQASDHNGTKSNVGTISITVGSSRTTGGGLRIVSQSTHTDLAGALHVVGEVENDKNVTAEFVKVIGTFYDVNGTVVGTSFTFTEPHDLAPGAKAPFDLILTSDQSSVPINQIKRYSLQLTSD